MVKTMTKKGIIYTVTCPRNFLESPLVESIMKRYWEQEVLEKHVEEDAFYQDVNQKHARDKDIVRQRM